MNKRIPIYVLSGGTGASGEQLVRTVLAQFRDNEASVRIVAHLRQPEQIIQAVNEAARHAGLIAHTLVDPHLRQTLIEEAEQQGVPEIDLMGALLSQLGERLGQEPLAHPGLYRRLRQAYFDRVSAIEYTLSHDDGLRSEGWSGADAVLVGPSRVGKTPLSMYLAVLGWKVANVPLIPEVDPARALFQLDRRRVFGLLMEPGQLVYYRTRRQGRMGARGLGDYADANKIHLEIEAARTLYRRSGFTTLDVTDRPIEATADTVIDRITQRFGSNAHHAS
jgi:regulator of PEP synthase PpsR (kinase-PPPase family)